MTICPPAVSFALGIGRQAVQLPIDGLLPREGRAETGSGSPPPRFARQSVDPRMRTRPRPADRDRSACRRHRKERRKHWSKPKCGARIRRRTRKRERRISANSGLTSAPSLEQPRDVQSQHEDHQHEDEDQAEIREHRHRPLAGGLAADAFVNEKHHVPAVEHRDRQEIQHGQVRAQERQEDQQLRDPLGRARRGGAGDPNRTCRAAERQLAADQLSHGGRHLPDRFFRLPKAEGEGLAPRVHFAGFEQDVEHESPIGVEPVVGIGGLENDRLLFAAAFERQFDLCADLPTLDRRDEQRPIGMLGVELDGLRRQADLLQGLFLLIVRRRKRSRDDLVARLEFSRRLDLLAQPTPRGSRS